MIRTVLAVACLAGAGFPAVAQDFNLNQLNLPEVIGAAPSASEPTIAPVAAVSAARERVPNGKEGGTAPRHSASGIEDRNFIYHGGPVMVGPKHLYYIWYGDWSKNPDAVAILEDFAKNIGGSPYFNIFTTYYDTHVVHVQNAAVFLGSAYDAQYSQGKDMDDGPIQNVVTNQLWSGALPADPEGVYFVLTSSDVQVGSFCHAYCGWHTHLGFKDTDIKYLWVGDPARCPTACADQSIRSVSANGNLSADAMASMMAHELGETVTDPNFGAWYNKWGAESGDVCAWKFGRRDRLPNGAWYNTTLGSRKYLLQMEWVNDPNGGYCDQKYP